MNVRDLQISLRPRKGWEAVDLGFILTKSHYKDLLKIGFISFFPLWVLLFLLLWKVPWLTLLLIWWAKPIYDRFYLHYLSRRIFGNEISVKEVVKKGPSFWFKRSLPLLTIRRFSPVRTMTLPVHDLEQLKGKEYGVRCEVVKRIGGDVGMTTTMTLHLCESFICISLFILGALFMPQLNWGTIEQGYYDFMGNAGAQLTLSRATTIAYALTYLFLEPFYVGAGFCLYLNSRTSQEAWDIELRFKEFATRVKSTMLKVSALVLLGGLLTYSSTNVTYAESPIDLKNKSAEVSKKSTGDISAQEVIQEVYLDEDFKIHTRLEQRWEMDDAIEDAIVDFFAWLFSLGGDGERRDFGGAEIMNILFWCVAAVVLLGLLILLAVVLVKQFKDRGIELSPDQVSSLKKERPQTVMGMEITEESLPTDLLGSAREAWHEGNYKQALSYLYRGALSRSVLVHDAEIEESDTEYECLRASRKVLPSASARYLEALTKGWIKVAYSKETVTEREFNTLCETWAFKD